MPTVTALVESANVSISVRPTRSISTVKFPLPTYYEDEPSRKGNRHMISRNDEARLFPNYHQGANGVPIVPGATFNTPRRGLQGFARLGPVDKISSDNHHNIRESGPVPAQGRPTKYVNQETKSRSYGANFDRNLSGVENADIEELSTRPVKRQRREGSTANSDRFINLTDNESSTAPSITRRPSRLSPASSQHSASSKSRRPSLKLDEFRQVEMAMSSRSQNKHKSNKKKHFGFGDDLDGESFTRNATKQRRSLGPNSTIELSDSDQPAQSTPKQEVIQSIEIHKPQNNIGRKSPSQMLPLRKGSVEMDGRHHSSGTRESTDELQGEATVKPVPKVLDESRKTDSKSPSKITHRTENVVVEDTLSTLNVSRTACDSGQEPGKQSSPRTKKLGSTKGPSHKRLFAATLFRFGPVERLVSDGKPVELHVDNVNGTIGLPQVDANLESGLCNVSLRKIREVIRGADGSQKVTLKLSSSEGTARLMDVELSTAREKEDLCSLIFREGVKVQEKSSEWMDKSFRRNRIDRNPTRYANGLKRPGFEVTSDHVHEPSVGMSKRPKLSASLQNNPDNSTADRQSPQSSRTANRGSDRSTATANATKGNPDCGPHSHLRPIDFNDSVAVQVKKFVPEQSQVRETRSMMQRGQSPLVCDDDDDDNNGNQENSQKDKPRPQTDSKDKGQKWKEPLVYPRFGKKKAEIDINDRERLRDNEFLNDNLIGFYMRFLEEHLSRTNHELAKKVYFFNSYFFATLTNPPRGKRGINYEGVQKWTRNVDIFSHDYIVVPINESAHWYVAIICNLRGLLESSEENTKLDDALVDTPTCVDGNEHSTRTRMGTEIQEIRETPNPVADDTPVGESSAAPDQGSQQPETAEAARQYFASMSLSDAEIGDRGSKEVSAAEGDRPENEDKQNASVAESLDNKNTSSKEGSKDSKEKHEGDTASSTKARKGKKKRRSSRPINPSRPAIITFDSLGLSRQSTIKALKDYLYQEGKSKRSVEIDTSQVQGMRAAAIPLQHNYSDCGLYLLAYIEKFVQNPDNLIGKLLRIETTANIGWPSLKSGLLRQRLRTFFDELYEEQERVGRDKDSDKNTLADRKPVSFLLGTPELNEVENRTEANTNTGESQPSNEAVAGVALENRGDGDDGFRKQITQNESSATVDQSKGASADSTDNTLKQKRDHTHGLPLVTDPLIAQVPSSPGPNFVQVPDSQEHERGHGRGPSDLSPRSDLNKKSSRSQPDMKVVKVEDKDRQEEGLGLVRRKEDTINVRPSTDRSGDTPGPKGCPNQGDGDAAQSKKKIAIHIPGTPPPPEMRDSDKDNNTVRRSPRYPRRTD